MRNKWIVLVGLLCACGQAANGGAELGQSEEELSVDLQHKNFVVEESGFLHTPGAPPDQPFHTLTAWVGNKFALSGSFPGQLTYDPNKPDGSGSDSTVFYSYLDNPTCTTPSVGIPDTTLIKQKCSGTEHVFFVGVPGEITTALDYMYVTAIGVPGQPRLDGGATHDVNGGAAAATFVKAERQRCLDELAHLRAFFASQGVAPNIDLSDAKCG